MRLRLATLTSILAAVLLLPAGASAVAAPGTSPVAAPMAAPASVDDFTFTSMDVDYHLGRDAAGNATLRTIENLVAVFPEIDQNHGIERAIPLKNGEVELWLDNISVSDGTGAPLSFSRSDVDGFAVLRIGSADVYVHGTQSYRIEYTMSNVVRSFADTAADEFYWDVNGTGWPQPFRRVSATVHLADGLASELTGQSACYQGYAGSTARCTIDRVDDTFTAQASDLGPFENMTIAIGFEPSAFVDPPLLREHWAFTVLPWLFVGLTGLAFLFVLFVRLFRWRDHPGRGIIVPEYAPSRKLYPKLAAEFLRRYDKGLPAQIIDLAVQRALALREFPQPSKPTRYELELLAGWAAMKGKSKEALTALFGSLSLGRKVMLESSSRKLGDRLEDFDESVTRDLQSRGWRAAPVSRIPRRLRWGTFWISFAATLTLIIAIVFDAEGSTVWIAALVCAAGWIIVGILATPPSLLTEEGAAMRDHLYGLRDYLALAETDRIRMLQSPSTAERVDVTDESAIIKLYEKLLPYAIIFGVEREWAGELSRHYAVTETPDWLSGVSTSGNLSTFTSSLAAAHFATTPVISSSGSSWSSSGGSSFSGGSSGGGSSGGGGGGGGGGGW